MEGVQLPPRVGGLAVVVGGGRSAPQPVRGGSGRQQAVLAEQHVHHQLSVEPR